MTHEAKALSYFQDRFHCSQSVLAAYAEEIGLTEQQALKIILVRDELSSIKAAVDNQIKTETMIDFEDLKIYKYYMKEEEKHYEQ